jgi:hypothetical protein
MKLNFVVRESKVGKNVTAPHGVMHKLINK